MIEQDVRIRANERTSELYFHLLLEAPEIAPLVQPGQFAHVRISALKEALLRRPFSIYQVGDETISILYKVVGRGTAALAQMRPGQTLNVIAPLGHGFGVPQPGGETPLLVAGGYGMAALYLLARRSPQKGIVFAGARRAADLLCEAEFRALGWDVRISTQDGSRGHKGLVTEPLRAELERTVQSRRIFACGPTPMLRAVARLAEEFDVPAEVSLDQPMCCGLGVCLTCVVPVRVNGGWEYQRACTEGPVFDARKLLWDVPT